MADVPLVLIPSNACFGYSATLTPEVDSATHELVGVGGGEDAVTSVAGRTGEIVLTKTDVGLANVDNTSDAAKPVSTATQTALDLKAADNAVLKLTGNQTALGTKTFRPTVAADMGVIIKGQASQANDYFRITTSTDAVKFSIDQNGNMYGPAGIYCGAFEAGFDVVSNVMRIGTTGNVFSLTIGAGGILRLDDSANNIALLQSTAPTSYGGGTGVVFIKNGATAPTTNPTGGVLIYAEGGALKCRGSGGTVTTMGPA